MPDTTIELAYDPLLLPTAQHRAGLAGLLVLIQTLEQRRQEGREIGPLPATTVDDAGIVRLTLSKASLQTLLDDLFAAVWESRTSKTVAEVTNAHDADDLQPSDVDDDKLAVPKAEFLQALGMPDIWRKLWCEAVLATLRRRYQTQIPYRQSSDGQPVKEAGNLWTGLTNRRLGAEKATGFGEPLLVGSQSKTADGVSFEGAAREALLLYFWTVVALMGQARQTKTERVRSANGQMATVTRDEDAGYVFTVPDVVDPEGFADLFRLVVEGLDSTARGRDYRPVHGVWALPQEGALEYLHHLARLATARAANVQIWEMVTGVEIYQIKKLPRGISIVAVDRVEASPVLAGRYAEIRERTWSPVFRAQRLLNLLRDFAAPDVPWYRDFDKVFARLDWELFAGAAAGPFAHDARLAFGEAVGAPDVHE